MKLTAGQFRDYVPLKNHVVTEIVFRTDMIKFGDMELWLSTEGRPGDHQPVVQKVIKTPPYLVYGKHLTYYQQNLDYDPQLKAHRIETHTTNSPVKNSMPWKVEMELLPGDVVWVNTMALLNAERQDRVIECDEKKYFLVPYNDIYLYKRDKDIKMINGWILVEPEKTEEDIRNRVAKLGIIIPSINITRDNQRQMGVVDRMAVVRYIGEPIYEYIDGKCDSDDISVGDRIVFKFPFNRRLESETHRFFDSKELIVTRRTYIVAKIVDSLF